MLYKFSWIGLCLVCLDEFDGIQINYLELLRQTRIENKGVKYYIIVRVYNVVLGNLMRNCN